MPQTWLQDPAAYVESKSRKMVQLPDGTQIFVISDSGGTNYELYYSNDHNSRSLIASWSQSGGATLGTSLCVDKAGNIYVQWIDSTALLWCSAFVRTPNSYDWTPAVPISFSGGGQAEGSVNGTSLLWCNTGGGADGAGHLLCVYETIFAFIVVGALDAGVALAGSGAIVASAFQTIGTCHQYGDASPDGFGSLQGLLAYRVANTDQPSVMSWRMSTFGVVTLATVTSVGANFSTTINDLFWLLSFGPGQQQWVMLSLDGSRNAIAAAAFTMTEQLAAPVSSAPSGGDWAQPSPQLRANAWNAFSDPNAPGRVYVLSWGTTQIDSTRLLGLTCTTMTWDAVDTLADPAAANPPSTSYQENIVVVNEPQGPVTDYQIFYFNGTHTVAAGNYAQPVGSPNTPTNLAPANNAYVDVTLPTVPLTWSYNNADGPTQTAFAIRFKIAGAASYRYWDVAGGISSDVPVWNPGVIGEFDMPSAAFLYGNAYLWSVATQSSTAVQSSFAAEKALNASAPPDVAFDDWIGPFTNTSYPTLNWTTQPAIGTEQISWHLVIQDLLDNVLFDTGVVGGEDQSLTLPIALPNGGTYSAQITATQTGGLTSPTFIEEFSILTQAPAVPALTVMPSTDPLTGAPRISLSVQSLDNMLSAIQASFETSGTYGWTAVANCVLNEPVAVLGGDGDFALQMQAVAAGNMSARTVSTAAKPNRIYTALTSLQAATVPRNTSVAIVFEDSTHTTIVTYNGAGGSDVVGDFSRLASISALSPNNTAFVYLVVTVTAAAANEIHFVDMAGIFLGTTLVWTINNGGYSVNFFYSDDDVNWFPVRGGSNIAISVDGVAVVNDYESPPTRNRYYRAQMAYDGGLGITQPIVSPYSAVTFGATQPGTDWWIKDPIDTSIALAFNQDYNTDIATTFKEKATLHTMLGRKHPIKVSDGMMGEDGIATVVTATDDDWKTLVTLMTRAARTLLLQSPFGYQWYVDMDGARNIALPSWLLAQPIRTVQIPYVEVDMP